MVHSTLSIFSCCFLWTFVLNSLWQVLQLNSDFSFLLMNWQIPEFIWRDSEWILSWFLDSNICWQFVHLYFPAWTWRFTWIFISCFEMKSKPQRSQLNLLTRLWIFWWLLRHIRSRNFIGHNWHWNFLAFSFLWVFRCFSKLVLLTTRLQMWHWILLWHLLCRTKIALSLKPLWQISHTNLFESSWCFPSLVLFSSSVFTTIAFPPSVFLSLKVDKQHKNYTGGSFFTFF